MSREQPNNALHGITLKAIVEDLVARHGFAVLAARINIRCFAFEPSVASSLKFLRKTEWARKQVEQLYLEDHPELSH
ncbi:MAG TPA: VF530 family protein [Kofleriaceae bacterium]|nr:VF530 family protein [Kofleriaceae bacterium]